MGSTETELKYAFSRNDSILVVLLSGRIDEVSVSTLGRCKGEIDGFLGMKAVVIDFSAVNAITAEAIRTLAQIQNSIRARGFELRLSSLSPDLRDWLDKRGILRLNEASGDIRETLSQLNLHLRFCETRAKKAGAKPA